MKNRIPSIGVRIAGAVKVFTLAAVMALAVPAFTGEPVASAETSDPPRVEFRFGTFRLCILVCYLPAYCCEVDEGPL